MLDRRASNAAGGPWSFRFLVEQMAPPGNKPGDFAEAWLRTLRQAEVEGVAVEDRRGVEDLLGSQNASAWPRAADGSLDLSQAPFRLLAIVNRIDLDSSPNGEGRLVFGLVDRVTGAPDLMAIAFEYRLPTLGTSDDRREWARRWHALAGLPFGEEFNAALETLTRAFTSAGLDPAGANGNPLSQLRSNEARFGATWQLRQWILDPAGGQPFLRPVRLPQTPHDGLNGSSELADFVLAHADVVRSGRHELPEGMLAGAASELGAWQFRQNPEIDAPLRHALAVRTCNGCHSSETASAQGFFHVNPMRPIAPGSDGADRLSPYLRDTQLGARAAGMVSLLSGGPALPESVPSLPAAPRAPLYDVVEVPGPVDGGAVAMDRTGKVLGNSAQGPWIWDGDATVRYVLPGGSWKTVATGFNSKGEVVGYEEAAPGQPPRAFLIVGDARRDLGTLGGLSSAAKAINEAGTVAGDSTLASGEYRGFLYREGAMSDLGSLGGAETLSFAINPLGQVAGQSQLSDGGRHAFLFDGQALRDLGSLGGRFARAQAINGKGQTAGMSQLVPSDSKTHAFFHDGVTLRDLGALPGLPWTSATGLNDAGVVVGNVYNKPDYDGDQYETFAFAYRDGRILNLNEAIAPSPFVLLTAHGIDEQGQILCTDGQADQSRSRAFVLRAR
ncbi:MAG: hypothetical protein QM765_09395 [Myxococcales bacterium]